jgi:hypothetical protein
MIHKGPLSYRLRILGALIGIGASFSGLARADQTTPRLSSPQDFAKCTDRWGSDPCLDALEGYVKAHPAQAFEAGKAVTLALHHWVAIPFFATAFAGKVDRARCSDERVALAVTSALALPNEGPDAKRVAAAGNILTAKCWDELKAPIVKALQADGGSGYLTANACPLLAQKQEAPSACAKKTPAPPAPAAAPRWETLDVKQLDVEGPAKVYRGDEGRRVTLVKVKGKDYYLIKFEGFRGPWNGKVMLHREDPAGTGFDYWTQLGKARHVSVVARRLGGSTYYDYEVFPRGDAGPFRVGYDETASRAVSGKAVLAELGK